MGNSILSVNQPSPVWYRRAKRVIGLLSGPTVLAFVQIFNPTEHVIAVIGQIIAFLPTVLELISSALTNGQEYAQTGTTQALENVTGQSAEKAIEIHAPQSPSKN